MGQAKNNILTFKHLFLHMNITRRRQACLKSMNVVHSKPDYYVMRYCVCKVGLRMGKESSCNVQNGEGLSSSFFIAICQLHFHTFLSVHSGLMLVPQKRTGGHQKHQELL